MDEIAVPSLTAFFNPVIAALRLLGNSAALSELESRVAEGMLMSDEVRNLPHVRNRGTPKERVTPVSEFAYRLRWALTYLKKAGYVDNTTRGVWTLTENGSQTATLVVSKVVEAARLADRSIQVERLLDETSDPVAEEPEPEGGSVPWEERLIETLQSMSPDGFERLAQRLLREAGFEEVIVTGKTGDGGIDGRGVIRLNELVGLSAVFQCKRYRHSIGPEQIREFRGAMTGRADRAIFITTARFTAAAQREASRDGVSPIELIDGERLALLLKNLRIGVSIRHVEIVDVDINFFDRL